jgi:hypothetical protein
MSLESSFGLTTRLIMPRRTQKCNSVNFTVLLPRYSFLNKIIIIKVLPIRIQNIIIIIVVIIIKCKTES